MWHLILPPFVIISGIGILLWFFSRKMDDPSFLSRVKSSRGSVSSFSRALSRKAFFLKLLEKTASKFKTNSLRVHNFFQYSLERVRERRMVLDEMRREVKGSVQNSESESSSMKRRWFGGRKRDAMDASEPVPEETPVSLEESEEQVPVSSEEPSRNHLQPQAVTSSLTGIFKRKRRAVDVGTEHEEDHAGSSEPFSPEPVLKKTIVHPERPKRRSAEKDRREELLIARIAENPRDAVSYEELGDLYLATGNMQDAKACYRQVLKLHPTHRAVKLKIRKVERFFEENVS